MKRTTLFLFLESALTILFMNDLKALYFYADKSPYSGLYSYILFVPFVSGFIFFIKRKEIFKETTFSIKAAIAPIFLGLGLLAYGKFFAHGLNQNDYLTVVTSAWLVLSISFFIAIFGVSSFKKALFPLLFLFFMVPLPSKLLSAYVYFLQKGSEEVSYILFQLVGVPIYRDNNVFQLVNFNLEVARECSGIRSSIGLWITALLTAYFVLEKTWYRILALSVVIPIAIFKNGIRIVTLGLLASYVDPIYITNHWLHKSGGILFFSVSLLMLFFPWVFFLRSREVKEHKMVTEKSFEKL